MMTEKEITQEQVNQLVEDAAYLQDEADALQYVIDNVPYEEKPPGKRSIAEILLLIDHAQLSYFRPIMEETVKSKRPTHIDNFTHYEDSFEFDGEVNDIQKILRKISKHRVGFVNSIKEISLIDWETVIYEDNNPILLFDFMQQMIQFERRMLKEIANRAMVYSKEKENRREIESRRDRQQTNSNSDDSADKPH